ncbi:hypothetical protein [Limnohabitans sp. T6-20]|uniref:hypothetical protein n=1 Tax=Limnohabitans sp. T6-20 TaxID=1100725 RepID=UPI0011B1F49A|nr:hypothetical protein [Limnohabitans sp. T6-20]
MAKRVATDRQVAHGRQLCGIDHDGANGLEGGVARHVASGAVQRQVASRVNQQGFAASVQVDRAQDRHLIRFGRCGRARCIGVVLLRAGVGDAQAGVVRRIGRNGGVAVHADAVVALQNHIRARLQYRAEQLAHVGIHEQVDRLNLGVRCSHRVGAVQVQNPACQLDRLTRKGTALHGGGCGVSAQRIDTNDQLAAFGRQGGVLHVDAAALGIGRDFNLAARCRQMGALNADVGALHTDTVCRGGRCSDDFGLVQVDGAGIEHDVGATDDRLPRNAQAASAGFCGGFVVLAHGHVLRGHKDLALRRNFAAIADENAPGR